MNYSRRAFIKRSGFAAATIFPTIISSRALGADAPSKRITLGFIGMGGQGTNANLKQFLRQKDAQVVAVCDAFMSRAHRARKIVNEAYGNEDCKAIQDFREVIADPAIDAVVISTPDHWHVPMSLMAVEAGKDVFCEKPTLSIHEGRVLADAFAKRDDIEFNYVAIPEDYEWVSDEEFDPVEMKKLFETGYTLGSSKQPWIRTPPGLGEP